MSFVEIGVGSGGVEMLAKILCGATLIAGAAATWHAYTGADVAQTSALWGLTLFLGLMMALVFVATH